VPSIEHYTSPGNLVLDGFSGSGMTGVAAQWCGRNDSGLSSRRIIQCDLSPAAGFISANYNIPLDADELYAAGRNLLRRCREEIGWMYEVTHGDGGLSGHLNYAVWSEVFRCPSCGHEFSFLEEAFDESSQSVKKSFECPGCAKIVTKRQLERVNIVDPWLSRVVGQPTTRTKRKPIKVNYSIGAETFERPVTDQDLEMLSAIESLEPPAVLPRDRMMHSPADSPHWGDEWRAGTASFQFVAELYLPRPAWALSTLWRLATQEPDVRLRNGLLFFVEQAIPGLSLMNRYAPTHYSQVNRIMSGRIRLLSQSAECSPWYVLEGKLDRLKAALSRPYARLDHAMIGVGSCTALQLSDQCIDYIFTDPPFGSNFAYAELNFLTECWHKVYTNTEQEAIVSDHQQKGTSEYQELMEQSFREYYRVLKPGHWITVVFSNSSNAIWRAIQEALGVAGFIIADVRTLDKKQGTFNQVHGVSVDQDLVISAYKPLASTTTLGLTSEVGSSLSVWAFVEEHFANVPLFVSRNGESEVITERSPQVLLDRMIAFHVQRGLPVPLDAGDFFRGLNQRYAKRDGMYFLQDQVTEYDKRRAKVERVKQLSFDITDEASAILWLRVELDTRPQAFQDLQPVFMRESRSWSEHEQTVELKEILGENFLQYNGSGPVPAQIHTYLSTNFKDMRGLAKDDPALRAKAAGRWYVPDANKQADLEQLRTNRLLKEFLEYKDSKQKKLKQFRTEAIRAGFKAAYDQKDYRTIIGVAKKLPEQVIQEDEKLLMYFDVASMRLGED